MNPLSSSYPSDRFVKQYPRGPGVPDPRHMQRDLDPATEHLMQYYFLHKHYSDMINKYYKNDSHYAAPFRRSRGNKKTGVDTPQKNGPAKVRDPFKYQYILTEWVGLQPYKILRLHDTHNHIIWYEFYDDQLRMLNPELYAPLYTALGISYDNCGPPDEVSNAVSTPPPAPAAFPPPPAPAAFRPPPAPAVSAPPPAPAAFRPPPAPAVSAPPPAPAISALPPTPAAFRPPPAPAAFRPPPARAVSALPPAPAAFRPPPARAVSALPPAPAVSALPPAPAVSALPPAPAVSALPPAPAVSALPPAPAVSALPPAPAISALPPAPAAFRPPPAPAAFRPPPAPAVSAPPPAPAVSALPPAPAAFRPPPALAVSTPPPALAVSTPPPAPAVYTPPGQEQSVPEESCKQQSSGWFRWIRDKVSFWPTKQETSTDDLSAAWDNNKFASDPPQSSERTPDLLPPVTAAANVTISTTSDSNKYRKLKGERTKFVDFMHNVASQQIASQQIIFSPQPSATKVKVLTPAPVEKSHISSIDYASTVTKPVPPVVYKTRDDLFNDV